MASCKDCKWFFERKDDRSQGDCVTRVVDARQAYHRSYPVTSSKDSSKCPTFQVRLEAIS